MGRIFRDLQRRTVFSDENVRVTCNYLNQCFETELDSILLAMEIVTQLLSRQVAEKDVIQSYRKLLTYISSGLHESNCSKIAIHFTRYILDIFYTPQTSDVHPVEVLLRSAYDNIFNRLVSEWTDTKCYELLLCVLFDFLKRDLFAHLKLDIVRALADAAGGGTRRLVRLLCVPKHLRDEQRRRKLKTILTISLAESLFRYESTKRGTHFHEFLKTIETMLDGVDFDELVKAKFLCLNLSRTGLTLQCVCFVFIVRHLDLLEGVTGNRVELDYVYNLIASVNILYHKRWKLPSFLVKHFIDGLSRFSQTDTFKKNVSDPENKMKAIFSSAAPATARLTDAVANIFGRLPATAQRIQWIQLQSDHFRAEYIFHQQLGILQERYIVTADEGLVHSLLAIFQTDTLLEVLASKQASPMARRNASVLLSRCSLTGPGLQKVLRQIKRSQKQDQGASNPGPICNWVRAVHGSVQGLNDGSKRVLWTALSTIHKTTRCSDEQRLLLVDTKASLLVSMMHKMEDTVVEMQVERTRSTKTARKRKLL
uniref:Uncharacterized protein n=1 Tax=Anopheles atroparvus TaxID=41427 RepID=A0A182JCR1_ANOAO